MYMTVCCTVKLSNNAVNNNILSLNVIALKMIFYLAVSVINFV